MELKMEEMTLMGVRKMSEEVGACREKEDNSVILPATTINSSVLKNILKRRLILIKR